MFYTDTFNVARVCLIPQICIIQYYISILFEDLMGCLKQFSLPISVCCFYVVCVAFVV